MWPWRHKKPEQRKATAHTWMWLMCCAAAVHILLYVGIFRWCSDDVDSFELSMTGRRIQSRPVLFVQPKTLAFVHTQTKENNAATDEPDVSKKVENDTPVKETSKELVQENVADVSDNEVLENEPVVEDNEKEHVVQEHDSSSNKAWLSMQRERELHEHVAAAWHPPIGVEAVSDCVVTGVIDNNGQFVVEHLQSSGVVLFDIAVRKALQSLVLPRWSYGKTVTLHFA